MFYMKDTQLYLPYNLRLMLSELSDLNHHHTYDYS